MNRLKKEKRINLEKYRGDSSTAYTGRPEGRMARSREKLSEKDKDELFYDIIIPTKTTAFNPSFYLGFFFDSIKKLGRKKFKSKYNIIVPEGDFSDLLVNDLQEGERLALNQTERKSGLARFMERLSPELENN